jgi:NAD(P)-dependent dehydrogenase (short-subunit alcohol dehydrogenase family)
MTERLAGRIGVVTGGASGIGAECARRFVAEGARVVLGDRNAEGLDAMAQELGADACVTEVVDVTLPADLDRLVGRATEAFGVPNLGFNAAGVGWLSPVHQHPIEQWEMVVDVCLRGVFLAMRAESSAMVASDQPGIIINVASINATVPAEGMSAYCAAKAAVVMLTRCAAMELGPRGIRVVGIAPGFIETPMTEYARALPGIQDAYVEPFHSVGRAHRATSPTPRCFSRVTKRVGFREPPCM